MGHHIGDPFLIPVLEIGALVKEVLEAVELVADGILERIDVKVVIAEGAMEVDSWAVVAAVASCLVASMVASLVGQSKVVVEAPCGMGVGVTLVEDPYAVGAEAGVCLEVALMAKMKLERLKSNSNNPNDYLPY